MYDYMHTIAPSWKACGSANWCMHQWDMSLLATTLQLQPDTSTHSPSRCKPHSERAPATPAHYAATLCCCCCPPCSLGQMESCPSPLRFVSTRRADIYSNAPPAAGPPRSAPAALLRFQAVLRCTHLVRQFPPLPCEKGRVRKCSTTSGVHGQGRFGSADTDSTATAPVKRSTKPAHCSLAIKKTLRKKHAVSMTSAFIGWMNTMWFADVIKRAVRGNTPARERPLVWYKATPRVGREQKKRVRIRAAGTQQAHSSARTLRGQRGNDYGK